MPRLAPRWGWHHRPATGVWIPPSWPAPPAPPTQYRLVAAVGRLRLTGRPATLTWSVPSLQGAVGAFVLTGRAVRLLRDAVILAETSPRGAVVDETYAHVLDEDGASVMPDA